MGGAFFVAAADGTAEAIVGKAYTCSAAPLETFGFSKGGVFSVGAADVALMGKAPTCSAAPFLTFGVSMRYTFSVETAGGTGGDLVSKASICSAAPSVTFGFST